MKYTLLSLLIATLLSFCSAPKSPGETPPALVGTSWQLESYQRSGAAVKVAVNEKARLAFSSDGSISAHTGCNTMGGDFTQTGNQLSIQAFSTKMFCQPVAEQESTINEIMREPMTVSMMDGKLVLARADSKLVYAKATPVKDRAASATNEETEMTDPVAQPAASSEKANTVRIAGLFRYMADAANFTRCSDNQRFAVAMDGNFVEAERAYTKMKKSGEAAYMVFEAEIIKNPGEGHPQMLVIRKVVSSNQRSDCE